MTLSKLATLNGGAANDAEIGAANADLDLLALAYDDEGVIDARIARLASLNPIEQAREVRTTAKEFRVPVRAVERAVKQAKPTDTQRTRATLGISGYTAVGLSRRWCTVAD